VNIEEDSVVYSSIVHVYICVCIQKSFTIDVVIGKSKSTAQGGEFFPTFRKGAAKSVGVGVKTENLDKLPP